MRLLSGLMEEEYPVDPCITIFDSLFSATMVMIFAFYRRMKKMQAAIFRWFCFDHFVSPQRRKGRREPKGFSLPLRGRQGKIAKAFLSIVLTMNSSELSSKIIGVAIEVYNIPSWGEMYLFAFRPLSGKQKI